jgi:hypothetical protein
MTGKLLEPKLYNQAPSVCNKSGCGGTVFIPHEDGWQCFNCMKIIYKATEVSKKNTAIKRYTHDEVKLEALKKKVRKPIRKPILL